MANTGMDKARRMALYQQMAAVPPELRKAIAEEALNSQKSILAFPYYSTVRFDAALSGVGPFAYTIAPGPRKCFNYKIGDVPGAAAGFPALFQAGSAETNLLKASETRDNADVLIWGLALECTSDSDSKFLKQLWRKAYVQLSLSGTETHLLGPTSFFPAAGGLYGAGKSRVEQPALNQFEADPSGAVVNGNPTAGNYYRLPQAVRWEANGSGKKDTSLVVTISTDTPIVVANVNDRPACFAPPVGEEEGCMQVTPYDHPEDGTVFVDIRVRLISVSISERSTNT